MGSRSSSDSWKPVPFVVVLELSYELSVNIDKAVADLHSDKFPGRRLYTYTMCLWCVCIYTYIMFFFR